MRLFHALLVLLVISFTAAFAKKTDGSALTRKTINKKSSNPTDVIASRPQEYNQKQTDQDETVKYEEGRRLKRMPQSPVPTPPILATYIPTGPTANLPTATAGGGATAAATGGPSSSGSQSPGAAAPTSQPAGSAANGSMPIGSGPGQKLPTKKKMKNEKLWLICLYSSVGVIIFGMAGVLFTGTCIVQKGCKRKKKQHHHHKIEQPSTTAETTTEASGDNAKTPKSAGKSKTNKSPISKKNYNAVTPSANKKKATDKRVDKKR